MIAYYLALFAYNKITFLDTIWSIWQFLFSSFVVLSKRTERSHFCLIKVKIAGGDSINMRLLLLNSSRCTALVKSIDTCWKVWMHFTARIKQRDWLTCGWCSILTQVHRREFCLILSSCTISGINSRLKLRSRLRA